MTTTGFLTGLAQIVSDAGIGIYDSDRVWTNADTDRAVMVGPEIPEDPPQIVVLSAYTPAPDDPVATDSLLGVQFRVRGTEDPASVRDVNDALFFVLQGMHDVTITGVPLVLLWRQSSLPGPPGQNHRSQLSSNWYARIAQPSTYRTD